MGSPVNVITSNKAKNHLYNGAFLFFQRNLSVAVPSSSNTYTADRWAYFSGASQASTVSRQNHSLLPNSRKAVRVQRNSGQTGTATNYFSQSLTTQDSEIFGGKTVALSFRAMAGANYSATAGALTARVYYSISAIDQNFVAWGTLNISTTVNITTTMTGFSLIGNLPAGVTSVAVVFEWTPTGTAGANDWFQLEDCQLEIGQAATPFEMRGISPATELYLCQRYFEKSYLIDEAVGTGSGSTGFWHSVAINVADFYDYGRVKYQVQKRVVAAVSIYSYAGTAGVLTNLAGGVNQGNAGIRYQSQNGFGLYCSNNAMTTNSPVGAHWTADAEL